LRFHGFAATRRLMPAEMPPPRLRFSFLFAPLRFIYERLITFHACRRFIAIRYIFADYKDRR